MMPLASDLLMLAPHLAAVWMAARGRAFWSGVLAGVAFLVNAKGVFVLAVCALWIPRACRFWHWDSPRPARSPRSGCGNRARLPAYYEEVWKWGRLYAADTFIASPLSNGFQRTWHWAGFHAAILVAAALGLKSEKQRWKFAAWALLSLAAVAAGERFFSRYFLQLLPVAVIAGAAGLRTRPVAQSGSRGVGPVAGAAGALRTGIRAAHVCRSSALARCSHGPGQPRGRTQGGGADDSAGYHPGLGIPSGIVCLHEPPRRQPIPGFAAADRRPRRSPSDRFETRGGGTGESQSRGTGVSPSPR